MRFAAIGVLVAACLANAGGCGGSDQTAPDTRGAERATRDYLRAVFELDAGRACSQLSSEARADLVEAASIDDPAAPPITTCRQAVTFLGSIGSLDRAAAGVMDADDVTSDAASASIETVDAAGDSVVLRVNESEKTVALTQRDGSWTIDELDFSDVSGGS